MQSIEMDNETPFFTTTLTGVKQTIQKFKDAEWYLTICMCAVGRPQKEGS